MGGQVRKEDRQGGRGVFLSRAQCDQYFVKIDAPSNDIIILAMRSMSTVDVT